jgi:hypothetical protein
MDNTIEGALVTSLFNLGKLFDFLWPFCRSINLVEYKYHYHDNHILSLVIAPIILDYILHRDCSLDYRNSIKGRTTFGISRLNNDVTKAPSIVLSI